MSLELPFKLIDISNKVFTIGIGVEIVLGVIGSILSIYVFSRQNLRRNSPVSIYLLSTNGSNLIVLMTLMLGQMLVRANDNQGEWAIVSDIWCKGRNGIGTVATLVSRTCVCFAALDQYMATSHSVRRRQWSSRRLAFLAVILSIFILFSLTGIPILLFTGIISYNTVMVCSYLTQSFTNYNNMFFIPVVYCLLPISILSAAGILTWRNIRHLRRKLIRQLARMILVQIISSIITTVPLAVAAIYLAITTDTEKTFLRLATENLIFTIAQVIFYLAYSCSFYIYFLSSSEFRRTVLDQIVLLSRRILVMFPWHTPTTVAITPTVQ